MRVVVYPADQTGCGMYRLIWPARQLRAQGHDVRIVLPSQRTLRINVGPNQRAESLPEDMGVDGADVVVFQRLTHPWMAQAVPLLRARGVAVVVDVDDDLSAVHPSNPAYANMHPARAAKQDPRDPQRAHSWQNLADACRDATLVTVSTPLLLDVYARHGRGLVLANCLPPAYAAQQREDNDTVSWPAALATHPDDPSVTGGALARVVADGGRFTVTGPPVGCGAAFGLLRDPDGVQVSDMAQWPAAVARIGIGIVPLADTRFNAAKSWLKGLEMSACGVPWIGSPRAEYLRLHALGAGVLVDTPRRWYKEITRLRGSEAAREELSQAGRAAVAHLTFDQQAWRWAEAWAGALELQRGTAKAQALSA